jgi:hypothetical protein
VFRSTCLSPSISVISCNQAINNFRSSENYTTIIMSQKPEVIELSDDSEDTTDRVVVDLRRKLGNLRKVRNLFVCFSIIIDT